MERIIYDFGMNNGDDVPYYLQKGTKVVGVEANPAMCDLVRERFQDEIRSGKLQIENCVLADGEHDGDAGVSIHQVAKWYDQGN